jgi:hypothetical protein
MNYAIWYLLPGMAITALGLAFGEEKKFSSFTKGHIVFGLVMSILMWPLFIAIAIRNKQGKPTQ